MTQAAPSAGQQASAQTMAALRLLRAVLGAPGSPFVSDWALVDFYGQYNFLHFARLFHDLPGGGAPLTALCKAHLQVEPLRRPAHLCICTVLSPFSGASKRRGKNAKRDPQTAGRHGWRQK